MPIQGTTKLHRLEENIGAADVLLSAEELSRIEDSVATVEVRGERYPAHLAALQGR